MIPAGAIFLSYASQDTEPARRIAEGLRRAGLEVWFDQSELRGGDAWDAKIRRHVKDCALFIPIVSANTEARSEGYFRLEWKLAVDRSHLLADDRTFLMPVVIDDTRDTSARVPEGFHARQWTRLPGGETTPQFVAHVQQVLDVPHRETFAQIAAPAAPIPAQPPRAVLRPIHIAMALGTVGAIAIVLLAFQSRQPEVARSEPPPQTRAAPPSIAAAPAAAPVDASPDRNSNAAPITTATRPERTGLERKESAPKVQPQKIDLLQPAVLHASDAPQIQILPAASISQPQELAGWNMRMELSFWESIKGSTMVEDYDEYLKQYPDGRFAGLARNRLKALRAPKR